MYGDILKINSREIRDKIYACWCGKNIGGTLGAPYEGKAELFDIKDFVSEKGKIIPNDDLDLQLVWLVALERNGPYGLSASVLAEYWIDLIPPHWSEYGICKGNLRCGIMPSACGELNNQKWKDSNGAWIRTEIWACTAPGLPQVAVKYAYMDACVDHGMGEGTYAALFTAALESIAFREKNIKKIINEALEYIPKTSRIYKSVSYVIESYDNGVDWKEVRKGLMKMDSDIGTWMAPANVGYVIIGLLYGEGDFKKSMLTAVNCGDDTDCTAATVGAFLGILGGSDSIPAEWKSQIGDGIDTVAVDSSFTFVPKDLNELTDRVFRIMPMVLKANRVDVDYVDGISDFSVCDTYEKWCNISEVITKRSPYTYDGVDFVTGRCMVEYDTEPVIGPLETITGTIDFAKFMSDTYCYQTKVFLPDGWSCELPKNINLSQGYITHANEPDRYKKVNFSITAGENVECINRIPIEITAYGRPTLFYVPIVLQGR